MRKTIVLVITLCILLSVSVAGCGTKQVGEVNVYNWGEYIDESIFDDFTQKTGIKVNYTTFQNNEELYSSMNLGGSSYDVIIPSDYMVSRLLNEGMLEKLDYSNIPNYSQISDSFKNPAYDPGGEYSVAYMSGTVGLIYNSTLISDDIDSWSALFDERYAGQILMFDNPRDAFGIALKYLGYSQNTTNTDELQKAYELLELQKPMLQAYVMDQIFDKLESGEAAIGPYYAGDYLSMIETNPDLVFVRPAEGSNKFVDAMCIPKGAQNKKNAELFINYMCEVDVCLANMNMTGYVSANGEAAELYGEDVSEEHFEIMFASDETLSSCDMFITLPQNVLELYDKLWIDLKK